MPDAALALLPLLCLAAGPAALDPFFTGWRGNGTGLYPDATPPAATDAPAAHAGGADPTAPKMPKWVEEGIERYGATAIFAAFVVSGIGLHLSEDFILIPAGWLAAQDWRLFGEFALAAYLGIVLGDAGWFWMCRTFGTRLIHTRLVKRMFHPRRLLEIKWQIDRRGAWVLLAARFIPGTRTPVISMCGVLHMAWWKLLLVEGLCVLVTAPMQMMIGWLAFHAAAKAGVYGLTRTAAIELQKHRVTVNALAPIAKTRMTEDLPMFQSGMNSLTPDHVAPAALFLASDLCGDRTGHEQGGCRAKAKRTHRQCAVRARPGRECDR